MHPDRSLPYSLTVQWESPANSDKFDLDHYTIQALSSVVDKRYELNVTGSKLEYPFGRIMNASILQHELSNLSVSAVSRCSQKGLEASTTLSTQNVGPGPMDVSTDSSVGSNSTDGTVRAIPNGNELCYNLM